MPEKITMHNGDAILVMVKNGATPSHNSLFTV